MKESTTYMRGPISPYPAGAATLWRNREETQHRSDPWSNPLRPGVMSQHRYLTVRQSQDLNQITRNISTSISYSASSNVTSDTLVLQVDDDTKQSPTTSVKRPSRNMGQSHTCGVRWCSSVREYQFIIVC